MNRALVSLCLLVSGCATTPPPAEGQGPVGGAAGCFAHGIVAAADSGTGELLVAGIALMPLCAMLAASRREPAHAPAPWVYVPAPKTRGLVSRK